MIAIVSTIAAKQSIANKSSTTVSPSVTAYPPHALTIDRNTLCHQERAPGRKIRFSPLSSEASEALSGLLAALRGLLTRRYAEP